MPPAKPKSAIGLHGPKIYHNLVFAAVGAIPTLTVEGNQVKKNSGQCDNIASSHGSCSMEITKLFCLSILYLECTDVSHRLLGSPFCLAFGKRGLAKAVFLSKSLDSYTLPLVQSSPSFRNIIVCNLSNTPITQTGQLAELLISLYR